MDHVLRDGAPASASDTKAADGREDGSIVPAASSSVSAPSNNPQAIVPEGMNLSTLTALPSATLPSATLPSATLPAVPPSVTVAISRPSTKHQRTLPLLHGPVPEKGSKQDRFRQFLENGTGPSIMATGTSQQQPLTGQGYSPGLTAVGPPFFTLRTPTSTCISSEDMDGAVATLSEVKAKAFQAVQTSFKDSALTGLRPTIGETRGSSGHQPMKGGRDTQNHPVATARLSAQCQLRHFNPKWQETVGPKGFKCSVQLRDKVIHGDHAYPTPNDAKQAVAEKALGFVRRLPRYESAQKGTETVKSTERADTNGDRNRVGRAQAKAEPIAIAGLAGLHGQYAYAAPVPTNVNYNWGAYNTTEQAALLHRMQSIVGSVGPSPAVLSDPLAAQAFLQGLAVGASVRAAGAACDPYFEPQARPFPMATSEVYRHYDARERSPAPTDGRNYRDRSSPDQGTSHESRPRRFK